MFGISFSELLLVGLVALLVLGPERLPGAARTAGLWVGRLKRSFNAIKQEVEREIGADEIRQLIDLGRTMLAHPVELLEGVAETLAALAPAHRLLLITKGDLRDQERKLSKSGLADHFQAAEIVSEKDEATYAAILKRHGIAPSRFLMVGNSLKSDIFPVLALGGSAVHLPYHLTWKHERSDTIPLENNRFFTLGNLRDLPPLVDSLLSRA